MIAQLTLNGLAEIAAVAGPFVAALVGLLLRNSPRRATAFIALFTVFYGLGLWAFIIEPKTLAVRRVEVDSAQWKGAPIRIGVISDTHVGGPHMPVRRMREVVAQMNREKPDLVVLLGDYAAGHEPAATRAASARSTVQRGIAAFKDLDAPLGVVAIIGNHDAWYDEPSIERALAAAGAWVANNSAVRIERPQGAFWAAGLADLESTEKRSSVAEAMAAVPQGEDVLFLTHFPDPWQGVPDRVALTLAGHTHCGQVNFPIVGRLVHASRGSARWPCGLYREGDRQLYVSGGVGVSILPVRFRAPPEIAVVTLKSEPLLALERSAH